MSNLLQGLHSASIPGILSLDVHQKDTSKVVTGGADKNATVFNKDTEQVSVTYETFYLFVSYREYKLLLVLNLSNILFTV